MSQCFACLCLLTQSLTLTSKGHGPWLCDPNELETSMKEQRRASIAFNGIGGTTQLIFTAATQTLEFGVSHTLKWNSTLDGPVSTNQAFSTHFHVAGVAAPDMEPETGGFGVPCRPMQRSGLHAARVSLTAVSAHLQGQPVDPKAKAPAVQEKAELPRQKEAEHHDTWPDCINIILSISSIFFCPSVRLDFGICPPPL